VLEKSSLLICVNVTCAVAEPAVNKSASKVKPAQPFEKKRTSTIWNLGKEILRVWM
jgi:hypothetical protein